MSVERLTKELKMSRRALYSMFKDKEDLLAACLDLNYREEIEEGKKVAATAEDVIDVLLKAGRQVMEREFTLNPNFYYDILHYYPELRDKAIRNNKNFNREGAAELIAEGIRTGLFEEGLDPKLVGEVLILLYEGLLREDIDEKLGYTKMTLINKALAPYLKGICTLRGLEKLTYHTQRYQQQTMLL